MKKLWAKIKSEPVMVAAAINIGIAWLATQGFTLSADQTALIWSAAAALFGAGVRTQVSPSKV